MSSIPIYAVPDVLVLAAIDRAERHSGRDTRGVPVWAVLKHLDIANRTSVPATSALAWMRWWRLGRWSVASAWRAGVGLDEQGLAASVAGAARGPGAGAAGVTAAPRVARGARLGGAADRRVLPRRS